MKCAIPEIAWHNREPVLSADIQKGGAPVGFHRLATGGADSHVLIWHLGDDSSVEIVADLARHQKAVNVVRWSPDGALLASGDDEAVIIVWKRRTDVDPPPLDRQNEHDREIWLQHRLLRGHLEDVYDLSWSPSGDRLVSGSVDNAAIVWDVQKGKSVALLNDHKGFVQGVSWDPKDRHVATMSGDRVFRMFDIETKKVIGRNHKTSLPVPENHPLHGQAFKLYHDDTLQSYFRRLHHSPDGDLIAVPTGLIEKEENGAVKHINVTYIYKRSHIKGPVAALQCGDSPSLVAAWNPVRFALREDGPAPLFKLPRPARHILAVATRTAVLLYDTQQTTPIAIISNIHYTRLTDLTWSADGHTLLVSSTDGYCSIIKFSNAELGEELKTEPSEKTEEAKTGNKENVISDGGPKTPKGKSAPRQRKNPTPTSRKNAVPEVENRDNRVVSIDEAAMEPWSRDGMTEAKVQKEAPPVQPSAEIIIDEPTEDLKMVFEETDQNETEKSAAEVNKPAIGDSSKPLPKAPRRVNFITLSSPKNKKKQ